MNGQVRGQATEDHAADACPRRRHIGNGAEGCPSGNTEQREAYRDQKITPSHRHSPHRAVLKFLGLVFMYFQCPHSKIRNQPLSVFLGVASSLRIFLAGIGFLRLGLVRTEVRVALAAFAEGNAYDVPGGRTKEGITPSVPALVVSRLTAARELTGDDWRLWDVCSLRLVPSVGLLMA